MLELYPSASKPKLCESLLSHYSADYSLQRTLRTQLSEAVQSRREQAHKNEDVTRRLAEVERRLQESDRERERERRQCEEVRQRIGEREGERRRAQEQEEIVIMLRRSQEALETAN